MDCETARLFLHFDRPGEHDLDGPEADELHAHLEHCSACNSLAQTARRLDQHLGRAMRAAPVPAGLKGRLLERLAADRRLSRRRRVGLVAKVLGVAACLLLFVWAGWSYVNPPRKHVYPDNVLSSFNVGSLDRDGVNERLTNLRGSGLFVHDAPLKGADQAGAPDFVNYAYLWGSPSLAELPGYAGSNYARVPQLVFLQETRQEIKRVLVPRINRAFVFILDERRFDVGDLENSGQDYRYKLAIERKEGFTYLILHNGKNPDSWEKWLKVSTDGV
jgi:hypothetical protein